MLRIPKSRPPTTIGEMLIKEFLQPLGLSQRQFAEAMQVNRSIVSAILNDRRPVSATMALRLSRVLGTSPDLWLRLQMLGDLYRAQRSREAKEIRRLRRLGG